MPVYKRAGSKFYWYNIRADGKRYQGSTGQTTQKEAEDYEQNKVKLLTGARSLRELSDRRVDVMAGGSRVGMAEAWAKFLTVPASRKAGTTRTEATRRRWQDFIFFLKDNYPSVIQVADIPKDAALAYINHVREKGRWHRKVTYARSQGDSAGVETAFVNKAELLSDYQKNEYLNTCRMVMARLMHLDAAILANPFEAIPKIRGGVKGNREAFTVEEILKLYEAALTHADKDLLLPIILLGAGMALRLSDIASLRWENLNLDERFLNKCLAKTASCLRVPLWSDAVVMYLAHVRSLVIPEPKADAYCFPALHALHKRDARGVSAIVKAFLEANGFAGETTKAVKDEHGKVLRSRKLSVRDIHSFRHSFAAIAGTAEVPFNIVQMVLGHTSPRTTAIYTQHARDNDLRAKLAKMPAMFQLPSKTENPEDKEREALSRSITATFSTMPMDKLRKLLAMVKPEPSQEGQGDK